MITSGYITFVDTFTRTLIRPLLQNIIFEKSPSCSLLILLPVCLITSHQKNENITSWDQCTFSYNIKSIQLSVRIVLCFFLARQSQKVVINCSTCRWHFCHINTFQSMWLSSLFRLMFVQCSFYSNNGLLLVLQLFVLCCQIAKLNSSIGKNAIAEWDLMDFQVLMFRDELAHKRIVQPKLNCHYFLLYHKHPMNLIWNNNPFLKCFLTLGVDHVKLQAHKSIIYPPDSQKRLPNDWM